jgi:hypothetical protein
MEVLPQASDRLLALGVYQDPCKIKFALIVGRLDRPKFFFALGFVFVIEVGSRANTHATEIKVLDLVGSQALQPRNTTVPDIALRLRPCKTGHTFVACTFLPTVLPSPIPFLMTPYARACPAPRRTPTHHLRPGNLTLAPSCSSSFQHSEQWRRGKIGVLCQWRPASRGQFGACGERASLRPQSRLAWLWSTNHSRTAEQHSASDCFQPGSRECWLAVVVFFTFSVASPSKDDPRVVHRFLGSALVPRRGGAVHRGRVGALRALYTGA